MVRSPAILSNAFKVSLIVGTVLNVVNQGEEILNNSGVVWGQFALNYLVPFCVASFSGAKALNGRRNINSTEEKHV